MVILCAEDWVCIFLLFVVWTRCPTLAVTGGWLIFSLVFKWFPLCEFSLFDTVSHELPDVQVGFRKGRGTRDQIANIWWIIEKAKVFQKNIYFSFIDYAKVLILWIIVNCGKFWKEWAYLTTWPASWETCMQVRKQQLQLDMEQLTG